MKHYIVVTVETEESNRSADAIVNEIASNLQSVMRDYGIVSATVANGGAVDKHYQEATIKHEIGEWSGHPDPTDPDNYWIDDKTGQRIKA